MVRQRRRNSKDAGGYSHDGMQQWRIRILKRNSAVPQREPREIAPVVQHVAADGDECRFDGTHVLAIFECEKFPGEINVDCQYNQRETGRSPRCLHRKDHQRKLLTMKSTTGSANKLLSMRSSHPPCPGSSVPLSLTPAPRFSADSHRSPI